MAEREQNPLVSLAARLGDRALEWNEIDFVEWGEFRRMAPTVVRLEVGRIERLMAESLIGSEFYNGLVRLRYSLKRFIDDIENSDDRSEFRRADDLEKALLALSLVLEMSTDRHIDTLRYVAHRLTYVHDRIKLMY